eukprot:CAMPEP_0206593082 /NCGR_PEP_ID=MMETSP0325_2-20121206/41414_1 /ASSEMBLY_ACC=CAM_ASM_000347 /TAXON_ID=2866 /ORGANISM="Crypthecodinium cohnii, Strain Seligo" /LENGTH=45 /DNA_ID= /DNA_START= /DNA_END= /DNA_ORIENTATION=
MAPGAIASSHPEGNASAAIPVLKVVSPNIQVLAMKLVDATPEDRR